MPTLEWIGKSKVINHHQEVPFRVLERKYSFDENGEHSEDNGSDNMIIRGDNLEALKALLPRYEGRVKCIYIDPPYNTGNEGWVYNDNVNDPKIKKWLGEVVGKEGEDLTRHDKWLCMMYPRLKLLQKLLADDGVIFISIDDREQVLLRMICNEIFGENNFLAQFVWQKRTSPDMRKLVSTAHEYVCAYCKDISYLPNAISKVALSEEDAENYKNPDNDPRGPWASSDFTAQGFRPNQMYEIITPGGARYTPPEGRCWKNVESEFIKQRDEGRMWFGADGKGIPRRKTYLSEREGKNVWTWWDNKGVGHSQEATKEIGKIFGTPTAFDYPNSEGLLLKMVCSENPTQVLREQYNGLSMQQEQELDGIIRELKGLGYIDVKWADNEPYFVILNNSARTYSERLAEYNAHNPINATQGKKVRNTIFISHRSTDKGIADMLVDFFAGTGISKETVFCSSLPGNDINERISDEVRSALKSSAVSIAILSHDYYQSAYCLNEAGVLWYEDVPVIPVALPEINLGNMYGFLNNEYKLRRLDSDTDISYIYDTVSEAVSAPHTKASLITYENNKLRTRYAEYLKARELPPGGSDNSIADTIAEITTDDERIVLYYILHAS